MSKKKLTREQIRRQSAKEYKKSVKRLWICVLCLVPVMVILSSVFAELKFPVWLAILLNVTIGGFVCLLVYIIFDKIDHKKKMKELLEPDDYDPFSD